MIELFYIFTCRYCGIESMQRFKVPLGGVIPLPCLPHNWFEIFGDLSCGSHKLVIHPHEWVAVEPKP